MTHIVLTRAGGAYDRRAIMALALFEYRAVGGRSWGDCQRWAWEQARKELELLTEGRRAELQRLHDMRAHRIAYHRARGAATHTEAA